MSKMRKVPPFDACTYHWGHTESALCAHQCAQMWGSSAKARAHRKYYYRLSSVKTQLKIDFPFLLFIWKLIPLCQGYWCTIEFSSIHNGPHHLSVVYVSSHFMRMSQLFVNTTHCRYHSWEAQNQCSVNFECSIHLIGHTWQRNHKVQSHLLSDV